MRLAEEIKINIMCILFWLSAIVCLISVLFVDTNGFLFVKTLYGSVVVLVISFFNINLYIKRQENIDKWWRALHGGCERE